MWGLSREGLTGFYSGTYLCLFLSKFVSKGAFVFKTEWALVTVFQFSCFSKYILTVFTEQAFKEINTIRQPLSPLTFITGIWDLTLFLASLRRLLSTHAPFLLLSLQSQDFTSWQQGTGPSTSHSCDSLPTSPADISPPRFQLPPMLLPLVWMTVTRQQRTFKYTHPFSVRITGSIFPFYFPKRENLFLSRSCWQ